MTDSTLDAVRLGQSGIIPNKGGDSSTAAAQRGRITAEVVDQGLVVDPVTGTVTNLNEEKEKEILKYDAHEQIVLSPQCIIESNNPSPTASGPKAFSLNTCNNDDVRFNVTHHDGSGITKVESEQILQIDTGIKGEKDSTSLQITSHKGDIGINAEEGSILIKSDGKSIVLDAENIIFKGRKLIQVGDGGQEIQILAKKIEAFGNSGNIPTVLSYHFLLKNSFLAKAAKGTTFTGAKPHPIVPQATVAHDN